MGRPRRGKLFARAAARYTERRGYLIDALAAHGVAATGRSGLAVWVPVADELAATTALLQRGWAVAPGERFRMASPPGIRIGTGTLTRGRHRPWPPTLPVSWPVGRGVAIENGRRPLMRDGGRYL